MHVQAPAPSTDPIGSHQIGSLLVEGHGTLLVVGPPGGGKTTLLLLLCRDLWRTASLDARAPAPAVLSLSTYRPHEKQSARAAHFHAWLVDELVVKYGLPRPAVTRWFDEAGIVLLLDGLDETDPSVRAQIVDTLDRVRQERPLSIVVTCRDAEYEAIGARLSFGMAVTIEPLPDDAMIALLEERHASQLAEQVSRDPALRELLRNPLLLTLYASRSGNEVVEAGAGFERAYGPYVEAAWARADAAERGTLQPQLAWLARAMRRRNTSDLWLERLDFGWLESRAEAIAAYASGALLVGLFSLGVNLAQVPYTHYPLASALVFGIGVWVSSFAYTRGRIAPVESLRWSWRRAARLSPITTLCALVIGLIEALKVNFAANMVGAGITGAILALLFALEPGERATKVRANAGVHSSLENALFLSLGAGLPVGLFFYGVVQPHITRPLAVVRDEYVGDPQLIVGVAVGLFVLTAMFLIYGGFTALMHYTLRLWLACRTPLPLDLARMCDRAVDLGLMRRVGGGYVFLHRTLLDHFAENTRAK